MTIIQNKQQNLKSQIKPKDPEDLKRGLKASYVREPFTITLNFEDLKGELKGMIFLLGEVLKGGLGCWCRIPGLVGVLGLGVSR